LVQSIGNAHSMLRDGWAGLGVFKTCTGAVSTYIRTVSGVVPGETKDECGLGCVCDFAPNPGDVFRLRLAWWVVSLFVLWLSSPPGAVSSLR